MNKVEDINFRMLYFLKEIKEHKQNIQECKIRLKILRKNLKKEQKIIINGKKPKKQNK